MGYETLTKPHESASEVQAPSRTEATALESSAGGDRGGSCAVAWRLSAFVHFLLGFRN
jgi:hypothetical protein